MKTETLKVFLFLFALFPILIQAQNVAINNTGSAADASAMLDIRSTSKGALFPRLDSAQINGIVQPANGLMVYCTTYNKPVYWDSTNWYFFDGSRMKPFTVGELYGGGIVFYVDGTGRHGLIAALFDLGTPGSSWGRDYGSTTNHSTIGSGQGNTLAIVMKPNDATAANDCNNFVFEGYSDWFLPSKDELYMLYLNRHVFNDYGVAPSPSDFYWSSTSANSENAPLVWVQSFPYSGGTITTQSTTHFANPNGNTRAIRAF